MAVTSTDKLLSLLGRVASDVEVQAALANVDVRAQPEIAPPENPNDEPVWFDWLLSSPHGVEFGFVDEAYLLAHAPNLRGRGRLALSQLYFYGDHSGVSPYRGDLPFNLVLSDDQREVRRKLSAFDAVRRSYVRDVWDLPEYRLIVTYAAGASRISSVLCLLRPSPWPQAAPEPPLPRPNQIVELFGHRRESPAFVTTFSPLGLQASGLGVDRQRVADLRRTHGFELYFRPAGAAGTDAAGTGMVFAAIKLYRDRDLDAHGYKGELPLDIRFDDPQNIIFDKIGRAPNWQKNADLQGFAVWHFPTVSLHLLYSNLENYLLRVTLMQHGFWELSEMA
jgi:hypothetical protein